MTNESVVKTKSGGVRFYLRSGSNTDHLKEAIIKTRGFRMKSRKKSLWIESIAIKITPEECQTLLNYISSGIIPEFYITKVRGVYRPRLWKGQ